MSPRARTAAVVAAATAVTFVLATGRLLSPALAGGALIVVVLSALAASRPLVAAPLAAAFVALVPVYWGRGIGGFGVAAIPITIAAIVLAPAALRLTDRFRPVALDVAVGTYLAVRAASFLLNYSTGAGAAVGYVTRVAAAYATFRLLGLVPGVRRRIAVAVVAAGGVLAAVARFERTEAVGNLFFDLVPIGAGFQAGAWARPELRFRAVRLEAGFGHPIPFGLFLALVLVLGLALAVRSRHRVALGVTALVVVAALLDTLSRGPLLVAIVGAVAWLVLERRHVRPGPVVAGAFVLAALLLVTPALVVVGALWSSSTGDTNEARSAEYRLQVAALLTDPEQFSMLGRQTDVAGDVGKSVSGRLGFKSLDNEYAVIYVSGGLLSLLAFAWIVFAAMRAALLPALDPVDRAWAVATAAVALGLSTVALLTQHADLFWVSLALVASAVQPAARKSEAARAFPEMSARHLADR